MVSLLRARRGCGALPIDEAFYVILILIFVFGYEPFDALMLTGRIGYWTFVLIVAPLVLFLLFFLSYDGEPIGGEREDWWAPYASQVNHRVGIERINAINFSGQGHDHHHGCSHNH